MTYRADDWRAAADRCADYPQLQRPHADRISRSRGPILSRAALDQPDRARGSSRPNKSGGLTAGSKTGEPIVKLNEIRALFEQTDTSAWHVIEPPTFHTVLGEIRTLL